MVLIGIMLVLGVTAAADAGSIEDFSTIEATPITVTPDPGGRSAILEVETTIDVACSVVYGTDAAFGSIAVDSDMNGGAHADHHPVMGGLTPDTEYLYRVQGTATDGTIYMSDVMSFRTPPAPTGGPPNLALDAVVTGVSSEFSSAFTAANAFDGDGSTEWSSAGDGDDAWIEIDLGSPRQVAEVIFHTRAMSDGSSITQTYQITADGAIIGQFSADEPAELDTEAQVLRFDVLSSSGGNTGAVEIEVLGQP
jgi:F5/8 type C domain